jgi:flagellar biosynthesis chaperone FliJ
MALFNSSNEELIEQIDNLLENHLNKAVAESFNYYLEQLRNLVDLEIDSIKKTSKRVDIEDKILRIEQSIENIYKNMEKINETNMMLHNEIKKRDAIIDRKTRQISRLKKGKNEI